MSLADNTRPKITWGDDWKDRQVRVAIVCHCGESFPIGELETARAHVASHDGEPGSEPT